MKKDVFFILVATLFVGQQALATETFMGIEGDNLNDKKAIALADMREFTDAIGKFDQALQDYATVKGMKKQDIFVDQNNVMDQLRELTQSPTKNVDGITKLVNLTLSLNDCFIGETASKIQFYREEDRKAAKEDWLNHVKKLARGESFLQGVAFKFMEAKTLLGFSGHFETPDETKSEKETRIKFITQYNDTQATLERYGITLDKIEPSSDRHYLAFCRDMRVPFYTHILRLQNLAVKISKAAS